MSLVAVADQSTEKDALHDSAEWCVRQFAEPPRPLHPHTAIPLNQHIDLQLQADGQKSFFLEVSSPMLWSVHSAYRGRIRYQTVQRGIR